MSGVTRRWVLGTIGGASLPLVGGVTVHAGGQVRPASKCVRRYYIGADTVAWDYVPQRYNLIDNKPFTAREQTFTTPGPKRLGPVYEKSVYRQYTDDCFSALVERDDRDAHLGLLGPVIRAEVGDTIEVVLCNKTPFPVSLHPHGVLYDKANEGVAQDGSGSGPAGEGSVVAPGGTRLYRWNVPERAGPGPADPSSVVWLYHDHSAAMGVPGTLSGLVGPIVITRRGAAAPDGRPKDVDREVFTLFTEFDENHSPYLSRNIERFGGKQHIDPKDQGFGESNHKSCINGYMFANGPAGTTVDRPAIRLGMGERVRWYAFGLGGEGDVHTPHWHGNDVEVNGHRTDVLELLPASMVTADMRPDNPGTWLMHCHVDEHMMDGMVTRYQVS